MDLQANDQAAHAPNSQQQQQQQQQHLDKQIAYAIRMRKLFSPPDMLNVDGSINQEFFRPKKVLTLTDKKWGDAEREQLYKGLHKFGVGKWREIGEELLPSWDDHSIRIKAAKLLGCQNLSWYYGRQLNKIEAQAEYEKNKQLGAQTGCWKNGMLVDDDSGTLRAHFRASAAATSKVVTAGDSATACNPAADAAAAAAADCGSADQQQNDEGPQGMQVDLKRKLSDTLG